MATVNSARSNFRDVISVPEAVTARLLALANVEIHILTPGADPAVNASHVNVYGSRNPADLAPIPQPIVTGAAGIVNFWAEPGEYDIFIHDRNAPARVADQRFGWSALSPVAKGIPAGLIRDDGALDLAALSAVIMRQIAPLGSVLDWWRPSSTYDAGGGAGNPPPGYEVCDGRTLTAVQHDFGTGGSVQLPDLRNKFVIGADIAKADGTTANYLNDTSVGAPGIRGGGGSQSHSLMYHESGMPSHAPSISVGVSISGGGHEHSVGDFGGNMLTPDGSGNSASSYGFVTFDGSSGLLILRDRKQTTGGGGHSHTASVTASSSVGNVNATNPHNNMPSYTGLLKIMKVRRA